MSDPTGYIGLRASVKTSLGETHVGVIFTYDSMTAALVLEQRKGSERKATYRVIKTSVVREIEVLEGLPPPAADAPEKPPLPEVSVAAIRMREERAIAKAKEEDERVCKRITVGQHRIFEAMNKTMPCEWMEKTEKSAPPAGPLGFWLVVLGEILVPPPYTPDLCVGKAGPTLLRVQKVLGGELAKLERAKQHQ